MSNISKYEGLEPEQLLEMLDINQPPFDPYRIAKLLKIEIEDNLDWNKLAYDGEIYINEQKNVKIWINQSNACNRRKFTVAHEIGHYVNDVLPNYETFEQIFDDKETLSFQRNGDKNFIEYRANDFAARLLMPKKHIILQGNQIIEKYKSANNGNKIPKDTLIRELSSIFEVSEEAIKWRLINLNLIKNKV